MERRKNFRFEFEHPLLAEMRVIEVNKRKVNIGSISILVDNLSLGGLKIHSNSKLPIGSKLKLKFKFRLMDEILDLNGKLVWINEGNSKIHTYGVAFNMSEYESDILSPIINEMTILESQNKDVPDTDFVYDSPYVFFNKILE